MPFAIKNNLKEIFGLIILSSLFIASALISDAYSEELRQIMGGYGFYNALLYLILTISSTVFAPLNTFFLLPVAVSLYGPFTAAVLSIIGWSVGAVIAFLLARTYGRPIVVKFKMAQKLNSVVHLLPKEKKFLWIVFARIAIPVDILSYAIGLFLPVSLSTYTIATIIGISPFAFIFAYASYASGWYLYLAGAFVIVAIGLGYRWIHIAAKKTHADGS